MEFFCFNNFAATFILVFGFLSLRSLYHALQFSLNVFSSMHMKYNSSYSISTWLHRIRLFHSFPFSCLSPMKGGICDSTLGVVSLCSVLLDDLRPYLLPVFVSFCVLMSITIPRGTRDVFLLLRYCLARRSKAT